MIEYKKVENEQELKDILSLQKANLPLSISEVEKINEGFVTVHHDFDLLKRMNDACPHIIAKDAGKVIGYTLCMHPKFGHEIDVLVPMFQQIEKAIVEDHTALSNFIVMGQVCVDKAYRRQGVFRRLYDAMKTEVIPPFSCIITEVDHANQRSLQAHLGIGFKTLTTYKAKNRRWELIYLV